MRVIVKVAQVLLVVTSIYLIVALILGLKPRNADFRQPAQGITIYLHSSGVHADLVLPVAAAGVDWRATLPAAHFAGDVSSADYVSFGWGDRACSAGWTGAVVESCTIPRTDESL